MKMIMKIKGIQLLSCLLCWPILGPAQSGDPAGPDKEIVCPESELMIGTPDDGESCYFWKPADKLTTDNTIAMPTAKPGGNATYTLLFTNADFSKKEKFEMEVTVNDEVKVSPEEGDDGNPIEECMGGRTVTFKTEAPKGFKYDMPEGGLQYTFNIEPEYGFPEVFTESTTNLEAEIDYVVPNVPESSPDQTYDIEFGAEINGSKCYAETMLPPKKLRVYRLWIDDIQHPPTGKGWQVVVGERFKYYAAASKDCTDWDWKLRDGAPWTISSTGSFEKEGEAIIPNSDMPADADWSDFGGENGTLEVSCKDEEDNEHDFASDHPGLDKKIKVYFNMDETTNPEGVYPNWFYYWKMVVPWNQIRSLNYVESLSDDNGTQIYGQADPRMGAVTVGRLAGGINDLTTDGGIHCFYQVLAHESYHIQLWNDWWGVGNPADPLLDSDGDLYPDVWESGAIAAAAGFVVGIDNSYELGPGFIGYDYEELVCRQREALAPVWEVNDKDWSYDPNPDPMNSRQGKQW